MSEKQPEDVVESLSLSVVLDQLDVVRSWARRWKEAAKSEAAKWHITKAHLAHANRHYDELRAERDAALARVKELEAENHRWAVLIHDLGSENGILRKANLAGRPAFLREIDTKSQARIQELEAARERALGIIGRAEEGDEICVWLHAVRAALAGERKEGHDGP